MLLEFARIRHRDAAIFCFQRSFIPFPFMTGTGSAEAKFGLGTMRSVALKEPMKTIILMSPFQQIPIELEKEVGTLDFALPSMQESSESVLNQQPALTRGKALTDETRESLH
jgi:hypothetical protein